MEMKLKQQSDNRYVINGYVTLAKTFKDAIAEYLSVHSGGSVPIFAARR